MALPDPPLITHLLLEEPWPLVVALLAAGAVLAIHGLRRQSWRLVRVAAGGAALAVLVTVLAALVRTDREDLIDQTRRLVAATSPLDLQALGAILDPAATLSGPNGQPWLPPDRFVAELHQATRRYRITRQEVAGLKAQTRGPGWGQASVTVYTTLDEPWRERPVRTRWLITWTRDSQGLWRVTDARWLEIDGFEPPFGLWR